MYLYYSIERGRGVDRQKNQIEREKRNNALYGSMFCRVLKEGKKKEKIDLRFFPTIDGNDETDRAHQLVASNDIWISCM